MTAIATTSPVRRTPVRRRVSRAVLYVSVSLLAVLWMIPIYWIVITSFKTKQSVFEMPPAFIVWPDFTNFLTYLTQSDFLRQLGNSVLVALASTALALVAGILAGYALARMSVPAGGALGFFFLATRFVAPIATVIPLFIFLRFLSLFDTQIGLILIYTAMNTPYAVWMMRGFFQDLPKEIEEAAWMDGSSRLGTLVRVVLPVSAGGVAATSVLIGMFAWNEFLFALMLTSSRAQTLPLSMTAFLGEQGTDWAGMAAAGTVILLPALVFAVIAQKQMASGLTFGAVKG